MQQLGLPSGFGLENLVGASVAVVPDASLSGRTDSVVVTEALKSISGRDQISVGRKGKTALSLRLGVRFVLAANETLALQDRTGALASRMVFLQMSVSWLGREDLELGDRLVLEASAILNWSLAGLRRLTKRGRFVQPATGMVALKEAEKVGSHVISFVEEHYDIAGEEWWVTRDNLYVKWVGWHSANNLRVSSRDVFFKDLRAAYPHLRDYQPKLEDGKQHKSFRGLKEKIND
jgi:putative DNA primase/helicase